MKSFQRRWLSRFELFNFEKAVAPQPQRSKSVNLKGALLERLHRHYAAPNGVDAELLELFSVPEFVRDTHSWYVAFHSVSKFDPVRSIRARIDWLEWKGYLTIGRAEKKMAVPDGDPLWYETYVTPAGLEALHRHYLELPDQEEARILAGWTRRDLEREDPTYTWDAYVAAGTRCVRSGWATWDDDGSCKVTPTPYGKIALQRYREEVEPV